MGILQNAGFLCYEPRGAYYIMTDISAAGVEQETGIGQVNQAIGEMDGVTQQNAALVEQAAAAAEALREQSVRLAATVSVFKVVHGGAPASPARHASPSRAAAAAPPRQAAQARLAPALESSSAF